MKKLSAQQTARYNLLFQEMQRFSDQLIDEPSEDGVLELNKAIKNAETFRDDIHSQMSDYYDERSEAWMESDAGEQYSEWMDLWAEELELFEWSEVEGVLESSAVSYFENLPLAVEDV